MNLDQYDLVINFTREGTTKLSQVRVVHMKASMINELLRKLKVELKKEYANPDNQKPE